MIRKALLNAAGIFFVILGAIGAIVPGMPTTIFLILAAGCFAKSSPRLYNLLLSNRVFGPIIIHWQETKSMPKKAKIAALLSIVVIGGLSITFIGNVYIKILVFVLLVCPIIIISRIPETESLTTSCIEDEEAPQK